MLTSIAIPIISIDLFRHCERRCASRGEVVVKHFLISSLVLCLGCGDDTVVSPDAPPSVDRPRIDAPIVDAPMNADAPADAMEMADAAPDATPLCPTPIRALTLPSDSYDGTLAG